MKFGLCISGNSTNLHLGQEVEAGGFCLNLCEYVGIGIWILPCKNK